MINTASIITNTDKYQSIISNQMDIDIDSLVPLPLSTSIVWKYFGFLSISGEIVDRNYVYCKRCKMRIKYSNNTSNLYKHFATHHSSDYEQLYALRKIRTGPDVHEIQSKRCKNNSVNDETNLNMNLLGTTHIKLDMVDPEPHYLDSCSANEPTKSASKSDIPTFQNASSNRFMTSSNYATSNPSPQNFQKKTVLLNSLNIPNQEVPASSVNNPISSNPFNYPSQNVSESVNFQNCNGMRKSIKSPDNPYKSTQWPVYYQNNNSPNSGVILDVLGALATVRRYCETNNLDLGLLQQLEKQIAVSELHRLSQ